MSRPVRGICGGFSRWARCRPGVKQVRAVVPAPRRAEQDRRAEAGDTKRDTNAPRPTYSSDMAARVLHQGQTMEELFAFIALVTAATGFAFGTALLRARRELTVLRSGRGLARRSSLPRRHGRRARG